MEFLTQNPIIDNAIRSKRLNWRMLAAVGMAVLAYAPACLIVTTVVSMGIISESISEIMTNIDKVAQAVFYASAITILLIVTLFAPTMAVSSIAGERQRQTLDLLLITLISTRSIVIGKLIYALVYSLLLIVLSWPIILVSLILGGVSFVELIATLLMLIVTAVAFTTIGLFVSSVGKTITNATMITYGLALPALFIAPPLVMLVITIIMGFMGNYTLEDIGNFYGWSLTLSLNPVGAAILSDIFYIEKNGSILISNTVISGGNYYMISPWILYIIFYSLISWILVNLTINRLEKRE